ncbi:hypothetical protein SEA_YABOI_151 [Streptomyces phage Yaboi]|uniref:Uncharacterized protein n=3 Tax=Streptomyces virus Yaboi TaxID=2846408 RepID=A0A385UKG3_9CAUD|nr:ClpP-like protease [Streptomyces phage Yaboi]QAY08794.1 hypothetical protein SEA_GENIE2_151 [Streptomyces phage Genie2]QAY12784.1 hypothetical protein SEA_BOOMERJR_151 [Streptomyces phage BoomerJR]UVD39978.1 hypothetical protein SEA_STANIMAL_149 [Streptomyces phage Stanimal]WNM73720.1 hypothetical protein SEA_SOLLERTIA_150 [Streptomyces phage Sollertia]AYB70969.1 hypothetical protein SEA_YABOI_151 [Streptomyces phage Yaboi]
MNLDFNTVSKMVDDVQFMLKCTFCTEPATTELTVEVGPDMVVPMPSCEGCKANG